MIQFLLALISVFVFANNKVPVSHDYKVETCLQASDLWVELDLALTDSTDSWLWPERLSSVVGEGLSEGAEIDVTYITFLSSETYRYVLSEVEENSRFVYSAKKDFHPFEGGAEVFILDNDSSRELNWVVDYQTDPSDWLQRRFFKNYSRRFFRQLTQNIQSAEKRLCK